MTEENHQHSPSEVNYRQFSVDEEQDGRHCELCSCCKRYCFKGYFWAVVGALCFFVVFPAGILLIIHGHYNGVALTVCLGILVMVVCICVLPGAYIGLRHWRRQRSKRQRTRRAALNAIKQQATFVNDAALINKADTASVVDVRVV